MAEVLITLGIIGIVAALTMPALITSYKKKATINGLKVAYSLFSQAVERSVQDNGPVSTWEVSSVDMGEKYINPYIETVGHPKHYGIETLYKYTSGNNEGRFGGWLFWPNKSYSHGIWALKNGMTYALVFDYNHKRFHLTVDINGPKGRNQLGKDSFAFQIMTDTNKLVPDGFGKNRKGLIENCTYEGNWAYYDGENCAALIMQDGWEISKDYPWGR